jgi:hypothetical protein
MEIQTANTMKVKVGNKILTASSYLKYVQNAFAIG